MSVLDVLWIIFILYSLLPLYHRRKLAAQRINLLRRLEKDRGSRVITMIHRQESISLLGIPLARYIDIEDSERVLRAVRLTPDDMPIDIVLHTPGGLVLAAEQIARALLRHPARVTVMVPHYAMSGGTMLALSADEIMLDENAVLGPVDPQLGQYPAASILRAAQQKGDKDLDDRTLILADIARKALAQVKANLTQLLAQRHPPEEAERLATVLGEGRWTHDYPLTAEELRRLGVPVTVGLPHEVYELMELYPQPQPRRPSVQYIPVPYGEDGDKPGRNR